jgi:hypothetical protein
MQAAFPFLALFGCLTFRRAGMTPTQAISAYVLNDLVRKLDPRRFPGLPPLLAALTGFVLGAEFVVPRIIAIEITDGGTVLARVGDDADERRVLGRYSDLLWNWLQLISRADLTSREFMEVQYLFAQKIGFPGPTNA